MNKFVKPKLILNAHNVANFLNFRAHEIYTINGNKIDETFVKWDEEKISVLQVFL